MIHDVEVFVLDYGKGLLHERLKICNADRLLGELRKCRHRPPCVYRCVSGAVPENFFYGAAYDKFDQISITSFDTLEELQYTFEAFSYIAWQRTDDGDWEMRAVVNLPQSDSQ